MNISKIRDDFLVLQKKLGGKPIIYFDNACMTLKPKQVVDKMIEYYDEYPACAGRSGHKLSMRATEEYYSARTTIKKFINAKSEKEIIFTRNTTEGINLVSKSLQYDMIITTDKEHNSNLVPWIQVRNNNTNIIHKIISTTPKFDLETLEKTLKENKSKKVLVSIGHTSNLDGTTNPVREIIKIAHENNAIIMLDGAQSVPHKKTDVKKLDIDLMAFSGHKMLGPTGTGVLYGKAEILQKLNPYNTGGDTVKDTFYDKIEYEDIPEKFEAGLQDYAGFIGLGEAARYLTKYIGEIESHEYKLNKLATDALASDIDILGGKDAKLRSGILSFNAKNGMKYHEISALLSNYANIMTRSGRHCVHSWFNANKLDGSARASFYLYNTEEEVKIFIDKLKEILIMKK